MKPQKDQSPPTSDFRSRPTVVLFACVRNAGRSQLAAAYFNLLADPAKARSVSAGSAPADRVQPEVAAVLAEEGIGLPPARPRLLTPALLEEAGLLVTMGCGESCPAAPGLPRRDWLLPDPHGKPLTEVRAIARGIRERVASLVEEMGWGGEA